MRAEHILLLTILIIVTINSIDTQDRDYKTHSELQKIKEHLEIKK